jgi:peroxiredoxin
VNNETPNTSSKSNPSDKDQAQIQFWVKNLGFLLFLLLAALFFMRHQIFEELPSAAPTSDVIVPEARTPVPEIRLKSATGAEIRLSDYKGKVLVLSFWASWCTPCLLELPTFGELHKRYQDQGLEVIAVNVEQETEQNFQAQFWKQHNLTFPNFSDPDENMVKALNVDTLPTTFIIDRQQRIVMSAFGANDWSDQKTLDFVTTVLNEQEAQ